MPASARTQLGEMVGIQRYHASSLAEVCELAVVR